MEAHTPVVSKQAMLVTLTIGVYTGRKQDRATQAEVVSAHQAKSARAASVYKNLFSDCAELDAVLKFQSKARARHYELTLPWDDHGRRLLPTAAFMTYTDEVRTMREEFESLVKVFLDKYDTLVAAAAFRLGTLFDRDEYLTREQVERRFRFDVDYTPVPTAGDFRVDLEDVVRSELAEKYDQRMQDQLVAAHRDAWDRLYSALSRLKDRLTPTQDGKAKVFHTTTVEGVRELCQTLTMLNVTNDLELESARAMLESALDGVTVDELRKEEGSRAVTLTNVNRILDAFNFGALCTVEVQ
jgi:hypothetical protein